MEIDLRDRLERSFRSEPAPLPVEDLVLAGRSALRRRRVLAASAATAVAVVIALGAGQLQGRPSASPGPIDHRHEETPAQVEARLTRQVPVDTSWQAGCGHPGQKTCQELVDESAPVGFSDIGKLVRISRDVVIAKRAKDLTPPPRGCRVEVELRTPASVQPQWWVVVWKSDGTVTAAHADPASSEVDFETWSEALNNGVDVPGAPRVSPAPVPFVTE